MSSKKKKYLSLIIACCLVTCSNSVFAEEPIDEDVVVYGDKENPIIENPYTTKGDTNVITREDIEKHNYSSVADAIKNVPGVLIATPGYKGGEYGYSSYNSELSINGENGIVVLVDGVRVDNDASAFAGTKAKVDLHTLPGINDVEQIEVIKGTGAAIYGADAAGGVLNIITRRGTDKPRSTLEIAGGSFNHFKTAFTHTGSAQNGSIRYSFGISRDRRGDSKYHDAATGKDYTFNNTGYVDENINFHITKEFDAKQSLTLDYSNVYELAYYPITAPDYANIDSFYNGTMAPIGQDPTDKKTYHKYIGLNSKIPGYRNIFLYDAWLGSYDEVRTQRMSAKYVFNKTDENAESYVRIFRNTSKYNMVDYSSIWNVPYTYLNEFWDAAKGAANSHRDTEETKGIAVQLANHIGNNSLTYGARYAFSYYKNSDGREDNEADRKSWNLYAQDKIKVSPKYTVTPGINYSYYSEGEYAGTKIGSSNQFTFSLYNSYDFDSTTNLYASASQIFRPVTSFDLSRQAEYDKLQDEKGWNWNVGLSKRLSDKDSVEINYAVTDMTNAIARYSVLNEATGKWQTKAVNASRMKRSMNLGFTHKFDDNWSFSGTYSWVNENYHAKNTHINPDGTTDDMMINKFRPRNVYRFHLTYDKEKWFADLACSIYSSNDTRYFTSGSFNVWDLALNYRLNKDLQLYLNVNNITNAAYETKALASYSTGALPEMGRNFMFGVKYSF